jgi:hypothetical protein
MPEASSRILLDRSVVRLDGRPLFSFGPRVLLSPQERFPQLLKDVADAGFNTVGSPPCSPGTISLINAFFDAAEDAGLMVMLVADPRLVEHGRYLAERFAHRSSLHSYVLPPRPGDLESLETYKRERDALRAKDLFHPIFMPLAENQNEPRWLKAQDVFSPKGSPRRHGGRLVHQRPGLRMRNIYGSAVGFPPRPAFCVDLSVFTDDEERRLGLYADDRLARRLPPNALDWFPYLANFANTPRRDLLSPDPELLRLQVYELLSVATRGILMDFLEAFGGPLPFTGRDRFCEATILAQELNVFHDFFSEGRPEPIELETGHPRLGAAVIRHGHDLLIVMRMEGYEEDYFIDEAYMERTEVSVRWESSAPVHAWRMDFPAPRPLEIMRDAAGSIRFLGGPLELTGLIMLTPGTQRSQDLARRLNERLPQVARASVEELEVRFAKIALIETELRQLNAGVNNVERLRLVQRGLQEARGFLAVEDYVDAYNKARETMRLTRQIIKYQMARALATPMQDGPGLRAYLRSNYFTLPHFYRQSFTEAARAYSDLT